MTALNAHKLTHPEGERWANQGVGELGESPGGAGVAELVLQRSSQRADKVPEAEQCWLCKKPSRQETAESEIHRYSVTRRAL